MFHPEHGTIVFGDPTDEILLGTPTTDNDKLYLQMAEWLSVYPDREGDDVLLHLPDPDTVCIRWRPILLNFLTCHWADGMNAQRCYRTDGAAYVAYYLRCPIRMICRKGIRINERRPVEKISWIDTLRSELYCPALHHVTTLNTLGSVPTVRARPLQGLEVHPMTGTGAYIPLTTYAKLMEQVAELNALAAAARLSPALALAASTPDAVSRRRPASAGSQHEKKHSEGNKKGRNNMMKHSHDRPHRSLNVHDRVNRSHLGKRKVRERSKQVVNVLGKGNSLWDSGSTYNVQQLPKNLPGEAQVAEPDAYNICTANGDRLDVTHFSIVASIGESVVCNTDCRILSPVQLMRTGALVCG
jgi:hypothetical protein